MSALEYKLESPHPVSESETPDADYFRPVPCVSEIDYDAVYEDVTKRFPNIIKRLAE
jgi:hypothetical protein